MNKPRVRNLIAILVMMFVFAGPLSVSAQESTPVASGPCGAITVPDGFECVAAEDGTASIVEATASPCEDITVPAGLECRVNDDGTVEIVQIAAATSPEAAAPTQPQSPVEAAASSVAGPTGDIINNNTNDVKVDVDVVNQMGGASNGGRVTLGGPCPDTQTAQSLLGAPVARAQSECAFFISYGDVAQMIAPMGWIISLQVDTDALIVFDGDGRRYNYKAFTARPDKGVCDVWAGQYLREIQVDDRDGVGYDTFVALPDHIATCGVNAIGQDASNLERAVRIDQMDAFVYDPSTTVPVSESTQNANVEAPATTTLEEVPAVVSTPEAASAPIVDTTVNGTPEVPTPAPQVVADPSATPVAAGASQAAQTCAPTVQDAIAIFGGTAEEYTAVGTNGWQYVNNLALTPSPRNFTVPAGMVVDYPGGQRALAGEQLQNVQYFTAYWCP